MKWTKLKSEFDEDQPFHGLLKNGDKLIPAPPNPVDPPEPDTFVSKHHDPVIDNCFLIFKDEAARDKKMWDGKDPLKRESNYHPWHYYENVPKDYAKDMQVITIRTAGKKNTSEGKEPPKFIPHPYEVFVGAWVHFYDSEVRHGETDHAVYFRWDEQGMNLTVFIYLTKPVIDWNVYVKVNPPAASQDPPKPKPTPPYCLY